MFRCMDTLQRGHTPHSPSPSLPQSKALSCCSSTSNLGVPQPVTGSYPSAAYHAASSTASLQPSLKPAVTSLKYSLKCVCAE